MGEPFTQTKIIEGLALAVLGCGIAVALSLIGMPFGVAILDSSLCPPLEPQGSFGQFGCILFVVCPSLLILGFTYGAIPFLRPKFWAICGFAALILAIVVGQLAGISVFSTQVTSVAFLIGCCTMFCIGFMIVTGFRLLEKFGIVDDD